MAATIATIPATTAPTIASIRRSRLDNLNAFSRRREDDHGMPRSAPHSLDASRRRRVPATLGACDRTRRGRRHLLGKRPG